MLGRNNTPFAAIGFEQAHRDGHDMGVIAVRGRYTIDDDGALALAPEQELILVDEYEGDPHTTPLLRAADLIPFKPSTDISILGKAYAPTGQPSTEWIAGLRIGKWANAVRINGRRHWRWRANGWHLSAAEPIEEAAMDYRNASGDLSWDHHDDPEVPQNPIGIKRPPRERKENEDALPVALLDSLDDDYSDIFASKTPKGFSPVPPFWRLRQQYAGTYDDAWVAERHPQLPEDFDYRFYQSAHPDMIYPGYLAGDESIELARLTPGGGTLRFSLPGVQPTALYRWRDGREVRVLLNLDGLHIDLRQTPYQVDITWRSWLPICPNFLRIELTVDELDAMRTSGLPRATIDGLSEETA